MRRIALFIFLALMIPSFSRAQTVDLLWQGETYTPPLYKGLPLWSNQSRVIVTAIPHLPNPSSLYYRWKKNDVVLGSLSGTGKNSIIFTDSVLSQPIKVTVDIRRGEEGEIVASATTELRTTPQRLLVYEDNPLYGLLMNRAVGAEYELFEDEVTFSAVPLFSTVSYREAPAIAYTWSTNVGDQRVANTVTYRAPEDGEGSSLVTLRATNSQILTQPLARTILIKFGNENAF